MGVVCLLSTFYYNCITVFFYSAILVKFLCLISNALRKISAFLLQMRYAQFLFDYNGIMCILYFIDTILGTVYTGDS